MAPSKTTCGMEAKINSIQMLSQMARALPTERHLAGLICLLTLLTRTSRRAIMGMVVVGFEAGAEATLLMPDEVVSGDQALICKVPTHQRSPVSLPPTVPL